MVSLGADPCDEGKLFARAAYWLPRPFLRAPWAFVFLNDKAGPFVLFFDAAAKVKTEIRLQLFGGCALASDYARGVSDRA